VTARRISLKLYPKNVRVNCHKHFFRQRVVDAWNRLLDDVGACSVYAFKDRLDKWMMRHGH